MLRWSFVIDAANDGFQSKVNCVDGSDLIYEFFKRTIINVENRDDKCIGEIMGDIQIYLNDEGNNRPNQYLIILDNI